MTRRFEELELLGLIEPHLKPIERLVVEPW
jgi:hypothetical protein